MELFAFIALFAGGFTAIRFALAAREPEMVDPAPRRRGRVIIEDIPTPDPDRGGSLPAGGVPRVTVDDLVARSDPPRPAASLPTAPRRYHPAALRPSDAIVDFIKAKEGFSARAYLDSANVWTIGYGHTGEAAKPGATISRDQADDLLKDDMAVAVAGVRRRVKVNLTQGEYDALVSFVFNLGETKFGSSTLLRKLNSGDYAGAAKEFPRWVYAGGERLAGLETRRAQERQFFLT
ncbi:MAG: lysozyme [Hyphococcus sp.]